MKYNILLGIVGAGMSDKASTPSSESTGSVILDNPQVYALLMTTIDERVAAGVQRRNENFRNWLIGILTVVVIILTAGGTLTLKYYVDAVVHEAADLAVAEAVKPAVARAMEAFRFDSEVTALNFRMLSLNLSESFTSEEAEAIIRDIQSLVSEGDEQRLSKLMFAIDTAVKNFAAAERLDLVLRLEGIAPDLFLNSTIAIEIMLHASGSTLIADAGAPASWTDPTGSSAL